MAGLKPGDEEWDGVGGGIWHKGQRYSSGVKGCLALWKMGQVLVRPVLELEPQVRSSERI